MARRGPYKQYELDATIAVPKSTRCDRRKRRRTDLTGKAVEDNIYHNRHNGDIELDIDNIFEEQNLNNALLFDQENIAPDANENIDGDLNDTIYYTGQDLHGAGNSEQENNSDDDINEVEVDQASASINKNNPIYHGADVTTAQSLVLVLAYILRHNLTHVALQDLLILLNVLLPDSVPRTKYLFFKAFNMDEAFEVHYYCQSCLFYLGKSKTEKNCESCNERFNADEYIKNGNYFLYLPVESQIKDLLNNDELKCFLTNHNDPRNREVISDTTSAKLYHKLMEDHGFSYNDLSLTWNTDGIPVFESSRYSIWPIQSAVNELPTHLRGKHILLHGLWFGKKKPAMNTFLKPFAEECKHLETNGFAMEGEDQPRRIFAHVLSADSPARAIVKNCKQYNGLHGCDWCEFGGETVAGHGGPPTRYYPYRGAPKMRTADKQLQYSVKALEKGSDVKGVKGPTIIGIIPTVDFMHCVCLGVTRQFVNLWLDSHQHDKPFYIGRKEEEIDNRLRAIDVPSEMTRAPRSIADRKFWKASEWRAFIFYSLIILRGLLPPEYLKHFFLFVHGIYSLLGDSITEINIKSAEACLAKFVIQVEELYGLASCSFNVHQLVHLAHSVRDCGPLWASSAFIFELNNHTLLKMFHGTQHIPKQIVETYVLSKKLSVLAKQCVDDEASPAVHNLLEKLKDSTPRSNDVPLSKEVRGVGKEVAVELTASQVLAVERLLGARVRRRSGVMFSRFITKKKLFSSVDYVRSKRHINSNVTIEHQQYTYGTIAGLLSIKPDCLCCSEELQYCNCIMYNLVLIEPMAVHGRSLYRDTDFNVNSYFLVEVDHDGMQIAVHPDQIRKKCISLTLDSKQYFCPIPYDINDN